MVYQIDVFLDHVRFSHFDAGFINLVFQTFVLLDHVRFSHSDAGFVALMFQMFVLLDDGYFSHSHAELLRFAFQTDVFHVEQIGVVGLIFGVVGDAIPFCLILSMIALLQTMIITSSEAILPGSIFAARHSLVMPRTLG